MSELLSISSNDRVHKRPNKLTNLFHLAFVAPILLYLGYFKSRSNKVVFYALGALSLVIPFVFGINLSSISPLKIVHLFMWVPLFLYVALANTSLPSAIYPLLTLLGISVAVVHGYFLLKRMREKEVDTNTVVYVSRPYLGFYDDYPSYYNDYPILYRRPEPRFHDSHRRPEPRFDGGFKKSPIQQQNHTKHH